MVACRISTSSNSAPAATRLIFWRVAHGSAQETLGGVRVAEAFGYVGPDDIAESLPLADRLLAMCWRLTHR